MARKPPKKGITATAPPDRPEPALPAVNPAVEPHDTPEESLPFSIVGIGASAGGLEAVSQLLRNLPPDTGMGFVLVQHLDPTHPSMLSEILSRESGMPVLEVTDQMQVEPNHVYVIP